MARVSLEDRFFAEAGFRPMAIALGLHEHEVIGLMACLWHRSQAKLMVTCDIDDMSDWLLRDYEFLTRFSAQCVRQGYLRQIEPGKFEIAGNAAHVENLTKLKENAKRGGEATKRKRHEAGQEASHEAGQEASDWGAQTTTNPIQTKPIQSNSQTTTSPNPSSGNEPVEEVVKECEFLFGSVSEREIKAFRDRWSENPRFTAQQLKDALNWLGKHPKAKPETASPLMRIFDIKAAKASYRKFDESLHLFLRQKIDLRLNDDHIALSACDYFQGCDNELLEAYARSMIEKFRSN